MSEETKAPTPPRVANPKTRRENRVLLRLNRFLRKNPEIQPLSPMPLRQEPRPKPLRHTRRQLQRNQRGLRPSHGILPW